IAAHNEQVKSAADGSAKDTACHITERAWTTTTVDIAAGAGAGLIAVRSSELAHAISAYFSNTHQQLHLGGTLNGRLQQIHCLETRCLDHRINLSGNTRIAYRAGDDYGAVCLTQANVIFGPKRVDRGIDA